MVSPFPESASNPHPGGAYAEGGAGQEARRAGTARPMDELCIDTIRTLAIDAVEKAHSGHPGTAMAMAPLAYELWRNVLRYDPEDPTWPDRDRFVLSAGHASMLLYAVLHLCGVKAFDCEDKALGGLAVTLDDIKRFRQLGSRCAGHPEYGLTSGVETTTGPLGQGCATSVGMAIAANWQAQHFNRPGFSLFDHDVYALCSDGDMMEGVASEAASLAGHLALGNLCWIYDNNRVTIEGHTDLAFSEDVGARFRAYGWHVRHVADANDARRLAEVFGEFRRDRAAPTLIVVDSHIGYGSPNKHDTSAAHGEPLGEEEVRLTKRAYGWPEDAQFLVPDGVRDHFAEGVGRRGGQLRGAWQERLEAYRGEYPGLFEELALMRRGALPDGWDANLPEFPTDAKGLATRSASGKILNAIAPRIAWLIGGAGDLGPSTNTALTFAAAGDVEAGHFAGRNLHFGIREHCMAAVVNGLVLSKLRGFGSTYLIFSDYLKPALRLSALMELPVVYIFTHDSIGLGEDGPTHQPIEQLATLRATPGLVTLRPADANEVVEAWRVVMGLRRETACLVLTRAATPTFDRTHLSPASGLSRGAYVLAEAEGGAPDVLLIGTGSEVALCLAARERLAAEGVAARVVSMPSWELFEQQDRAYREAVLPPDVRARVSVEAGSTLGWERYVGSSGAMVGMHSFGASAPARDLMAKFGFTVENVVEAARRQMAAAGASSPGRSKS